MKKYFLFEPETNINKHWEYLLSIIIDQADFVEFNILWHDWMMQKEFILLRKFKVEEFENRKKIFMSNKSVRYKLTPEVKEFVLSKKFSDWQHHFVEDPSFLRKGKEFIACRSNKGRICLLLSEPERLFLIEQGLDIWFELESSY
jgi:hypothetical protein